jgi:adenylyltransferase/sulfurtransferase
VEALFESLAPSNAERIIGGYDLVLDGTDDLETKFLIGDTAPRLMKPWIYASVTGFDAQLACLSAGGPGYRDLFKPGAGRLVQSCEEAGVLGAFVGTVGSRQALEAITWLAEGLGPRKPVLTVIEAPIGATAGVGSRWSELSLTIEAAGTPQPPADAGIDLRGEDCACIDVRTPEEFAARPREGVLHWPLSRLEAGEFPETLRARKIRAVCKSGARARRAAEILQQNGFSV